ncbi:YbaB/EbfC family nucleoid-associated protein [Nocardia thailandica]|uniref:YbaB/EbfC family nucleoid-associated protein n=1 Tax=Nocardia thailandica TaxID=257275 RepID=UPI0009FDF016
MNVPLRPGRSGSNPHPVPTTDPEFDRTIAEIRVKATQVQQVLQQVTGIGTAANGRVTATVDAAGRLRDLRLTPAAYRHRDRLPTLILQATASAEDDAARKAEACAAPTEPQIDRRQRRLPRRTASDSVRPTSPATREARHAHMTGEVVNSASGPFDRTAPASAVPAPPLSNCHPDHVTRTPATAQLGSGRVGR